MHDDEATSSARNSCECTLDLKCSTSLHQVLGGGGRVALMLAAQQKIYGVVIDLVDQKKDESEASKALVLSVSSLQLAPHEAAQYVGDSIRSVNKYTYVSKYIYIYILYHISQPPNKFANRHFNERG